MSIQVIPSLDKIVLQSRRCCNLGIPRVVAMTVLLSLRDVEEFILENSVSSCSLADNDEKTCEVRLWH